jgi:hypothetical protein
MTVLIVVTSHTRQSSGPMVEKYCTNICNTADNALMSYIILHQPKWLCNMPCLIEPDPWSMALLEKLAIAQLVMK